MDFSFILQHFTLKSSNICEFWRSISKLYRLSINQTNSMENFIKNIIRNTYVNCLDLVIPFCIAVLLFYLRRTLYILLKKSFLGIFLKPHLIGRFNESFFKFIFYSTSFYLLVNIYLKYKVYDATIHWSILDKQWCNKDKSSINSIIGSDYHSSKCRETIPEAIYYIYMYEIGFYIFGIFSTIYMDFWRKDSKLLLCHHFSTIALLYLSLFCRYIFVGILVLVCHDINDILLEFSKILSYIRDSKIKNKIYSLLSTISFVVFTISWLLTRILMYVNKVAESANILAIDKLHFPFLWIFLFLLISQAFMNIYWFYLITRILKKFAIEKKLQDEREEGDS